MFLEWSVFVFVLYTIYKITSLMHLWCRFIDKNLYYIKTNIGNVYKGLYSRTTIIYDSLKGSLNYLWRNFSLLLTMKIILFNDFQLNFNIEPTASSRLDRWRPIICVSTVFCSFVRLLSFKHIPHFHSKFKIIKLPSCEENVVVQSYE